MVTRETLKEVKGLPEFMKEGPKKKDEQKLEEMEQEIKEAEAREDAQEAEAAAKPADATPADSAEKAEPAEDPKKLIEELKAQLAEKDDQYLRLKADYANFRRRSGKEREELSAVVTQELFKDLLPIVDNFDRAMATEAKDVESFKKGVEMIHNQLGEVLQKNGLEVIETKGQKFDPNYHQAVMRVQSDELEDDTIAQELQKGYMVKGRVIRPSMVQVVSNA